MNATATNTLRIVEPEYADLLGHLKTNGVALLHGSKAIAQHRTNMMAAFAADVAEGKIHGQGWAESDEEPVYYVTKNPAQFIVRRRSEKYGAWEIHLPPFFVNTPPLDPEVFIETTPVLMDAMPRLVVIDEWETFAGKDPAKVSLARRIADTFDCLVIVLHTDPDKPTAEDDALAKALFNMADDVLELRITDGGNDAR
jgi:hypothetical protein